MHSDIHILAACTERKRLSVPRRLRLRTVPKGDIHSVARLWLQKLGSGDEDSCRADELYAGDHWATVRKLLVMVEKQGFKLHSWVISAGYGLLPMTARIHPYSATFADLHQDSVINRVTKIVSRKAILHAWWKEVCSLKRAGLIKPTSIAALARTSPKSTFVIIASPSYLLALEDDLLTTLQLLKDPNQLIIISSQSGALCPRLRDHIVPSVEALQPVVGGGLASLHARVASLIFKNADKWDLRADALKKRLMRLASNGHTLRKYDRKRLGDVEIRRFIKEALRCSPKVSCNTLLRQLRYGGRACEQKRFTELFWSEKERKHAS